MASLIHLVLRSVSCPTTSPIPVNDMVLPCRMLWDGGLVLLFICSFLTFPCKSQCNFWLHFFFCDHVSSSLSSWLSLPQTLSSSYRDLVYALANFFIIHLDNVHHEEKSLLNKRIHIINGKLNSLRAQREELSQSLQATLPLEVWIENSSCGRCRQLRGMNSTRPKMSR